MPIRHVVQRGDSVVKLAAQVRMHYDTIWDHPDNADLRKRRKVLNVLCDGDVIVIPDRREMPEQSKRRKPLPAVYRLQQFRAGRPFANRRFRFAVHTAAARNVVVHKGTTDDQGVLEVPIPADATEADLSFVYYDMDLAIRFGHAVPVETPEGQRERLESLGLTGDLNTARTKFQLRFGLPVTGKADDLTLARLEEACSTLKFIPPRPPRGDP